MRSFLRFLMRNRLFSLINLAGLTLSLALVIIIFSYASAQKKISRSVPDYENTYALARDGLSMMGYGISGLVAISIYYADANARSIAVHKVYGASTSEETMRNLRLYFGITLIADVLAVPVALVLCRRYLVSFSYRMELSAWIFIGTVLLSLLITFVSVILQIRRAAGVNPADTLKKE